MEEETDLSQNSALKVLYQKAQASLMFRLVKKKVLCARGSFYTEKSGKTTDEKSVPSSCVGPGSWECYIENTLSDFDEN